MDETVRDAPVVDEPEANKASAVLNWALALSTLLGAAAVVVYAYVRVLGSAGCSDQTCPRMGPGEVGYTLIVYGAPTIAVVTVLASFFTARRARGVLVPVAAWVLLLIAALVLTFTFSR